MSTLLSLIVGRIYGKLDGFEQAKEYLQLALAISREKLGDKHVHVATTYDNLGLIHQDLGDFEQAKWYFERASTIYVKKRNTKNVGVEEQRMKQVTRGDYSD